MIQNIILFTLNNYHSSFNYYRSSNCTFPCYPKAIPLHHHQRQQQPDGNIGDAIITKKQKTNPSSNKTVPL